MRWRLVVTSILAGVLLIGAVTPAAAFPTRSSGYLDGVDRCPVTTSNGVAPSEFSGRGGQPGDFGNAALWTNLWMWGEGEVLVDAAHRNEAGEAVDMKWAWYRVQPGRLTIEGRSLDEPGVGPLRAWVPDGYGPSGFQVSGITFPAEGCWQVTGRLLSQADPAVELSRLTFVVRVVYVDELPW